MADVRYHKRAVPIAIGRAKSVELPDRTKPAEEPREELGDFLDIELVDAEGKPAAGVRYRVTLKDGSIKEGRLDASGRARLDSIPPGLCRVSFPALDSGAWEAA
jgi:hypothetical protein